MSLSLRTLFKNSLAFAQINGNSFNFNGRFWPLHRQCMLRITEGVDLHRSLTRFCIEF